MLISTTTQIQWDECSEYAVEDTAKVRMMVDELTKNWDTPRESSAMVGPPHTSFSLAASTMLSNSASITSVRMARSVVKARLYL